ncbi:uncharacterized protein LOC113350588 [Papaver somniferum]|uniref:uncharacterized protein LOC113350588 n=1 Tax=Papaver somniferum TaxID=3469 RepID=UPI000E6FBFB8|nr:uncharacterized protein LOC113350588 [Papaver somniferum]
MFWNIRGLKVTRAKDKLRSLVNQFNPSLIWIAEPKVRAKRNFVKNLRVPGMSQMLINNSSDTKKGNIWLLWHYSLEIPTIISSTKQVITVRVGEVLVTGIHAACLTVDRRELWEELLKINKMQLPWLVLGDFNTILSCDEKVEGRSPLRLSMTNFNNCLDHCGLLQAPKSGIQFSWCNNRVGKKRILCDLDKAFFNAKWLELYASWRYKVGVKGVSDHGALMGSTTDIRKPQNIPFRYQPIWTSHPKFLQFLKQSWEEEYNGNHVFSFMSKLKRFKISVKKWNWEVFGDLRIKVKETEDEVLNAALLSDAQPENVALLDKLITARGKHEIETQQYNELLRSKSRIKWVKEGEPNYIFEHHDVFFDENLFEAIPKVITNEDNDQMDALPSSQEIKDAVFSMDPNSSPGPDGFPGSFYIFSWEIICRDLISAIQYCWRCKFVPKGMNYNFLLLLPKIPGARKTDQFRPIGLSNFCFKIITRIITTRPLSVLHKVISFQQGAFIKGRNIQEKIVLASELVNELDIKRRGGNVGLKLDIIQAFDSMSWEFIFATLKHFGLSQMSINWLKIIFESARVSVLVNGGPFGFFEVGRGLGQGDPLSPILFVIAEEVLSRNLRKMI